MIQVQNLSLTLSGSKILDNVNIAFEPGRIHGLVGRNGSGKTMLMKCIAGFIMPTRGTVLIDGRDHGRSGTFPDDIGLIIETPGFLPHLSGLRNLMLLARLTGKIREAQVRADMERVGLDPALKLPVKKYSLGMRQRLGIAQAIMERPRILLLDEPFNGLDKDGVAEMRNFLLDYCTPERTLIIASHNSEDIALLCEHVCEMDKGQLKECS